MRKVLIAPILSILFVACSVICIWDYVVEFMLETCSGWYDYWVDEWEKK